MIPSNYIHTNLQTAIKESVACEPWTQLAKHKLMVERELKTMASELDYVIVRPAIVYGSGDRSGISRFDHYLDKIEAS